MIKRIKVHSKDAVKEDPSYRFPGNYGVEKFLEIFSGKKELIAAALQERTRSHARRSERGGGGRLGVDIISAFRSSNVTFTGPFLGQAGHLSQRSAIFLRPGRSST